jgi:hypothetical protein
MPQPLTGTEIMRAMSRSVQCGVGDLFEVATPNGLAYLQCTHVDGDLGIVRVLPGLFGQRPAKDALARLCAEPERFFHKLWIRDALRAGGLAHVGSFDVPPSSSRYPRFREVVVGPDVRIMPPREEEPDLPIDEIVSWDYFVERIATGWAPRFDATVNPPDDADDDQDDERVLRHVLRTADRSTATQLRRTIEARGFLTELANASDGWALHAWLEWTPEEPEAVRAWLEQLARDAGAAISAGGDSLERRVTTLDHDVAGEFVATAVDGDSVATVERALRRASSARSGLDTDAGERALAAAELVAGARGAPADDLPDDALLWAAEQDDLRDPELQQVALTAVDAVLAPRSELRQLWEDAADQGWVQAVEGLRERLRMK